MIEMVELSYRNLKPNGNEDEERNKFIAMMFLDGADRKQCGYLMKGSETGHSLGDKAKYPESIEDSYIASDLERYLDVMWRCDSFDSEGGLDRAAYGLVPGPIAVGPGHRCGAPGGHGLGGPGVLPGVRSGP